MRRTALFLAAFLIASPAGAAEMNTQNPVFANISCGRPVSCSAYTGLETSNPKITALLAQANACVAKYFRVANTGSQFRDEMGLDSSRCLKPKPVPKADTGLTLTPQCCLVSTGSDDCTLMCKQVGSR